MKRKNRLLNKSTSSIACMATAALMASGSANAFSVNLNVADALQRFKSEMRGRAISSHIPSSLPSGEAERHSSTPASVLDAVDFPPPEQRLAFVALPGQNGWTLAGEGHAGARSDDRDGGIAFLDVDRLANFRLLRQRFLQRFLFGWRFNNFFANRGLIPGPPADLPADSPPFQPPTAVPLPGALMLLGAGLLSLLGIRRRSSVAVRAD